MQGPAQNFSKPVDLCGHFCSFILSEMLDHVGECSRIWG